MSFTRKVGGFAIAIFAGWVMCANSTSDELDPAAGRGYRMWRVSARFIAPVAVLLSQRLIGAKDM